ncbi:hypothetical protein HAX54_017267, partial [Datura stramonium]|nr:hypothetical protein [Datura stramonium]
MDLTLAFGGGNELRSLFLNILHDEPPCGVAPSQLAHCVGIDTDHSRIEYSPPAGRSHCLSGPLQQLNVRCSEFAIA